VVCGELGQQNPNLRWVDRLQDGNISGHILVAEQNLTDCRLGVHGKRLKSPAGSNPAPSAQIISDGFSIQNFVGLFIFWSFKYDQQNSILKHQEHVSSRFRNQ
jgi:hypothetical protein